MPPVVMNVLRRIGRDPLTYFVLVGGLLFVVHTLMFRNAPANATIVITPQIIKLLETQRAAGIESTSDDTSLDEALDQFIEEEVLVRYARSLGLERNDPVVRRRLMQKARIAIEDAEPVPDPTLEQLREFFDERQEAYRRPARVSFQHVFSPGDGQDSDRGDCGRFLGQIRQGADPLDLGKPFALGRQKSLQTRADVERVFGEAIAEQLFRIPIGQWSGPYQSRYGCHVVNVSGRHDEYIPAFEELPGQLAGDWSRAERRRRDRAAYARILERFQIVRTERAATP